MGDDRSSESNAGVVILIAIIVLALPCCGGVALLGLGVFSWRTMSVDVQPPMVSDPMPVEVENALPPDPTAAIESAPPAVAPAESAPPAATTPPEPPKP